MKKFRYSGPLTGANLTLADGSRIEVLMHTGSIVELPEDHDYTATLAAQGYLTEVEDAAPAASTNAAIAPTVATAQPTAAPVEDEAPTTEAPTTDTRKTRRDY